MCGIVGAFAFDKFETKAQEKIRQEAIIFITTQLLQETVDRGKDATGLSLFWQDGNYTGLKMGIPAPDFIARFGEEETDFEGMLKVWREYPKKMQIFLGHCRKSSVGNSYDNKNNHPIQVGDIVMVHNGTLTNHDTIFDKLDCHREGEVDSEAIARLLHHYTKEGTEPFTSEMLKETTLRLDGTYSVLAVNGNNPYQVAQFRDRKPAEMVLVRPLKTVFVASEEKFLKHVLFEFNKMGKLFAPTVKFPYLMKADCDFKTLQDDSMALWDLTVPIDDKTEIADLYDWEKIPGMTQRLWKSTTSSYNAGWDGNKKKTTTPTAEVDATNKKTDNDEDCGLVWSNSLNKYKTQKGIQKSKGMGAVEIDTETGKVTQVSEVEGDETDTAGLKKVAVGEVENLIDGAADINELALKESEKTIGSVADAKKSNDRSSSEGDTADGGVGEIREVDMAQHPDAQKAAEDFIEAGLVKYDSDSEVLDELDASHTTVLRNLPLFALANKVKKHIFKEAFMDGYVIRKLEEDLGDASVSEFEDLKRKYRKKVAKAEKRIALLKLVTRIMGKTLDKKKDSTLLKLIDGVLTEVLKKHSKLDNLDFDAAFTAGELSSVPLLKDIKERIEESMHQKE